MPSFTIRYKDREVKRLFDIIKAREEKTSEDVLKMLCRAYLSNPDEVRILAETWNGIIKIEDYGYPY